MEVALFIIVIAAVMIVSICVVARSSSASGGTGGISSSPSSYGGKLVGEINLTNTADIVFTNGDSGVDVFPNFSLVDATPELFSFNSTTKEITVSRSGNYLFSYNFTPNNNVLPTGAHHFSVEAVPFIFSVTQGQKVLEIFSQVETYSVGYSFNVIDTAIGYLPVGVYTFTGQMYSSVDTGTSTTTSFTTPAGVGRFTITTLY